MKLVRRILALIIIVLVVMFTINSCSKADDDLIQCWILCNKDSRVHIRYKPSKKGQEIGFLEVGDSFMTDSKCSNGYIKCYGVGDYGEGWIYSGYVVTEEPVAVFQNYVCAARKQVACRRWIGGPRLSWHQWLKNGSSVSVFYVADGWAVTNFGYVRYEWLDPDP